MSEQNIPPEGGAPAESPGRSARREGFPTPFGYGAKRSSDGGVKNYLLPFLFVVALVGILVAGYTLLTSLSSTAQTATEAKTASKASPTTAESPPSTTATPVPTTVVQPTTPPSTVAPSPASAVQAPTKDAHKKR